MDQKTTVLTTFGLTVDVDEREYLDLERQGLIADEQPAPAGDEEGK